MLSSSLLSLLALTGSAMAGPGLVPVVPKNSLVAKNSKRCEKADRYDMPLSYSPLGFLSNITYATPAHNVPVLIDWTWISQLIITPRCNGVYEPETCLAQGQDYIDLRQSNTFKDLSTVYKDRDWDPNHFFLTYPLNVTYGSDVLGVGPVSSTIVTQLSDVTFNASQAFGGVPFPFGGVFGLSPTFWGDGDDYQSPFNQQWEQKKWKSPLIGFAYCYDAAKKSSVCNGADGIQSLGGIRNDLIKNNKVYWYRNSYYPDVNSLDFKYDPGLYNYWAIELKSLKIGNESQRLTGTSKGSGKAAIFDHASYGRGMPMTANAYDRLVEITHGTPIQLKQPVNNGPQSFYSVDCNSVKTFPVVSYQFVGHDREWTMTPDRYVTKTSDGTCVLNVRVLGTGDKFMGNFGEDFAKDKYIVFDFEKVRVGIADIDWPSSS